MVMMWWFDDDRKKSADDKIAEALAAYERKFHTTANVVFANIAEVGGAPSQVRVLPQPFIQRSNFYIGYEEPS